MIIIKRKILVIGERGNCPQLTNKEVQLENKNWSWLDSLTIKWRGGSLNRLKNLIPIPYEVVNMLPPDNVCGSWDKDLAKKLAPQINNYLKTQNEYFAIILLGRRVMNTVIPKASFETVKIIGDTKIICLHHPSGRSGFWSKNNTQKVKDWLKSIIN